MELHLKPLRILVSGTSGLIGRSLLPFLQLAGHEVISLVRDKTQENLSIYWDPATGKFDKKDFEGFDAVIHLAGKNIASGRWTEKTKREIFLSRCRDTWLLAEIFLHAKDPPKTFICASATGYYGNTGSQEVTEEFPSGKGFLADVCKKWEEACHCMEKRGVRIIYTRFGAVLSPNGGILQKLLPLFRMGCGTVFGNGKQFFPWIALDDVLYAMYHCLKNENIQGPVNFVSPQIETFTTFCKKLAKVLHRPCCLRLPVPVLKIVFGQIAEEVFLPSIRAKPKKLLESKHQFAFPDLEKALLHMLS